MCNKRLWPISTFLIVATTKFATHNFIKMVKKRVRDAEVLPEAPVQASTQDDDSGSDEVDFLVTMQSPLLIPL